MRLFRRRKKKLTSLTGVVTAQNARDVESIDGLIRVIREDEAVTQDAEDKK